MNANDNEALVLYVACVNEMKQQLQQLTLMREIILAVVTANELVCVHLWVASCEIATVEILRYHFERSTNLGSENNNNSQFFFFFFSIKFRKCRFEL